MIYWESNPTKPFNRSPGNNCGAHWGKLVAALNIKLVRTLVMYIIASQA